MDGLRGGLGEEDFEALAGDDAAADFKMGGELTMPETGGR